MDDATVVPRLMQGDVLFRLQYDECEAISLRERQCGRQADNASADHGNINRFGHEAPPKECCSTCGDKFPNLSMSAGKFETCRQAGKKTVALHGRLFYSSRWRDFVKRITIFGRGSMDQPFD